MSLGVRNEGRLEDIKECMIKSLFLIVVACVDIDRKGRGNTASGSLRAVSAFDPEMWLCL